MQITATGSPFAQVDACFGHATVNAFPYSNTLLKKSKLPLALILQPYLSTKVEKVCYKFEKKKKKSSNKTVCVNAAIKHRHKCLS